jgi:cytochrome bd-type quinol oxidase subunit 2
LFAAFPRAYACIFSGLSIAIVALVFFRAVSIEFASLLASLLPGILVGNLGERQSN